MITTRKLVLRILIVLLCTVVLPAQAQIFKIPQPDTTRGNFFGVDVAISGNRALVGASNEDVCGESSGAAFIFEQDAVTGEWQQMARLTASDCAPEHFFGRSLSLSGDRAVITAFRPYFSTVTSNAVYIFERDPLTGEWLETTRLTAERGVKEGAFAASVALDGDRLLITASGDPIKGQYGGAAYIFERDPTGSWRKTARLTGSGSVRNGIFGTSGDLYGDRAVVSASTYLKQKPGSVYVFERDPATGDWHESTRLGGIDDFFISLDLHNDRLLVGESKGGPGTSGEATLFERDETGSWKLSATLLPKAPYKHGAFGTRVALFGDRALVVGYDEQLSFEFNIDRVVYVFQRKADGTWSQQRIIDVGEVAFGAAISLDGANALIGQASEQKAGMAYVALIH